MKSNWQTKRLEEICELFADGDWIEKKDQSKGGIRLIQTGNIGNGHFLNRAGKARYISEETFKRLRCAEVLPGDCLLSRLPDPVGRASLIPKTGHKMITAVDCTIMRFKKDTLPEWFIYYSLSQGYQNEINKEVTGATRQRISRSNLGNIKIPVPPVSEQQQLVNILDAVFERTATAKENAEKNLQSAHELFESYLQSVFENGNCEVKKLSELFDVQSSRRVHKADWKTEGIPFYRAREVVKLARNGFVNNELFISQELFNEFTKDKGAPKKNDIIISAVGTLGECYLVREEDRFYIKDASVLWFSKISNVDSAYIEYSFKSQIVQSQVMNKSMGATVGTLTISRAKNIEIPIPPLKEQQAIVNKLDLLSAETKKLESIYQQKLTDLEELRKSILQKAFNGDLAGACS